LEAVNTERALRKEFGIEEEFGLPKPGARSPE